jgi:hypothetical protein
MRLSRRNFRIGLAKWARDREAADILIDPKVWAGLCLARLAGALA